MGGAQMLKGLYRDIDGWVRVKRDDNLALQIIPKERYVASGSLPPFDQLPTKAEYEARIADRT